MQKVYVITGSTSGIGKCLVEKFAKDENNLIFAGYRNKDKIDFNSSNVVYFYIDMLDDKSVIEASDFIKSKTSKIDNLINVAGSVVAGPIEKIPVSKLKDQFQINTFSHLEFTQNLADLLKDSKVINISSMASYGNFPFVSPYCASKRALDIFFNAFAVENHKNIKVVSVKPGVIATPIWKTSVENNMDNIENCADYPELEFVKENALKNSTSGLDVNKVASLVEKIVKSKNPKASYTVGSDALFAKFLSYFPQDFVNNLVKFGLKLKMHKYNSIKSE